jgi:hypothetical protein
MRRMNLNTTLAAGALMKFDGRFLWVRRREPSTSHDSGCPECARYWPIQSGADFRECTGDDKYLH